MNRRWIFERFPSLRQATLNLQFPGRAAVAAAVALTVGGMVWWGIDAGLPRNEWAAWVQAVGSIGAIAGAWALGMHQTKAAFHQALRLRNAEHVERVRALFPIAARAAELVNDLANEPFDDYYRERYSEAAFRNCLRALTAIPLHELGKYGLVDGYLQMLQALEAAAHAAAKRLELGQMDFQGRLQARAADKHIDDAQRLAESALVLIQDNNPSRIEATMF